MFDTVVHLNDFYICETDRTEQFFTRAEVPGRRYDWEGVGVEPDIKVEASQALPAAHLAALRKIRDTAADARHRDQLDRAIAALEKDTGR